MWYELSCFHAPTNQHYVYVPFDEDELWIAEDTIRQHNEEFPGEYSEWVIVIRGRK